MECMYPRCAGLDVHKDTVVACVRIQGEGSARRVTKTFRTVTTDLLALADFLGEHDVTHVVMESTGVYWKPVWHILEEGFTLLLANAQHVKNVPGRKTDVNDAAWLADLLAHGLIRGSFVPPTPQQDLRSLMRTRKQLVREKAQHIQRIQKTLEDANIKIDSVISDVDGVSGRAILRGLIDGEADPARLLDLTTGRLRAPRQHLLEALRGHVRTSHRFLLKLHLEQIEGLEHAIASIDEEVGTTLGPFREAVQTLATMTGIKDLAAEVIISEIGVDMSRFASADHLVSWACMCPRNDESAGKRRKTAIRKGAPWLKATLVQAAWSATRSKTGYLRAKFHRIKARRGMKKAIIAVAASMLRSMYYMLRDGVPFRDLGADYFDRVDKAKASRRLVKRLENLGFNVAISQAA